MGELVKSAKLFANENHERIHVGAIPAVRDLPMHRKSVAQIVSSVTNDEETIAAAWLHDIVEDTAVTIGDLERRFGSEVARVVGELTVPTHAGFRNRVTRTGLAKQHFAGASPAAKTVKIADLIDSCSTLHKTDPIALIPYASETSELIEVLAGGDSRLLARLQRNLDKYAIDSLPAQKGAAAPRFRPLAIPIAALRVFEQAITAQYVAEPLVSFDSELHPAELHQAMTVAGIHVAGLHRHGKLWGFLPARQHKSGETPQGREFAKSQIVSGRSPLTEVTDVLTRHDFCFVSVNESISGVIARSDFHKPAVRMWLFGIITFTELETTERIRQKWPEDSWTSLVSEQRLERARRLYAERQRRKEDCDLLDCLQLSDKVDVLLTDPAERNVLGITSASGAQKASKELEILRNKVAHSQSFADKDWAQVARMARRIHQLLDGA
ncbi:HD domain-containing protein [Occallatibacter riparius]|uniref:HD domain-containing protein n=1 Tax=Occallatibacter riparius TaxID=1002689 RepID=A0A9J7BIC6_9BACT|nr:HD domain-containing protein [Occallatibacter riparius]UWZ82249.1 HD domain-containing protein [Occallatibacter riparius]